MKTGVCYYPEQWPSTQWQQDAARMKTLGLRYVRIGEFAWSRLESAQGKLNFEWLAEAIDVLHQHDLLVVLGTPTATPPRWMVDKFPDMLACDHSGQTRDFGSRRHYCFSHDGYLDECKRIVTLLTEAFGQHPAVVAWQTDNEYGCHSTSISYSSHALSAFRQWCAQRYASIDALNIAWGNVFWSMEYDSFEHIGLPVGTVTESNPAHQLAFWRFSSSQIQRFNKAQVDIIRANSPGRDVLHNFMGNFVEFDHHLVSQDLDIATWDNYPLGFLTRDNFSKCDQQRYLRTGHPDGSAFHHDLYRGCCNGRWWVMEQQPGPVNWAPYNPSPLPGMVRLWGWEAFAHGAEVMSYFRWRQAPFAQEQTHTGLLMSNSEDDVAAAEVAQLNHELSLLPEKYNDERVLADVAIVFSYAGIAIQDIQPPGGSTFSALKFCQNVYSACRQFGLNVDIVSPNAALENYRLVLVCNHTEDCNHFAQHLQRCKQQTRPPVIVLFPGSGSRSEDYCTPADLPPGQLRALIDIKVVRSESLPPEHGMTASNDASEPLTCTQWRERIQSALKPHRQFEDGWGFHYQSGVVHYINAVPNPSALQKLVAQFAVQAELAIADLGPDIRIQRRGRYTVAFNFGETRVDLQQRLDQHSCLSKKATLIVGSFQLDPAEVAVWLA